MLARKVRRGSSEVEESQVSLASLKTRAVLSWEGVGREDCARARCTVKCSVGPGLSCGFGSTQVVDDLDKSGPCTWGSKSLKGRVTGVERRGRQTEKALSWALVMMLQGDLGPGEGFVEWQKLQHFVTLVGNGSVQSEQLEEVGEGGSCWDHVFGKAWAQVISP